MIILVTFLNICAHFVIAVILIGIISSLGPIYLYDMLLKDFFIFWLPCLIIYFMFNSLVTLNPIYALLNILTSFIFYGFLLFNISCELLTFIFLIVYLGALMILFLFVIMLFNLQQLQHNKIKQYITQKKIVICIFILYFYFYSSYYIKIIMASNISPWTNYNNLEFFTIFFFSNITTNGDNVLSTLYLEEHGFLFVILTLILLFSMVAAIAIVRIETTSNTNKISLNKHYKKI
jgi:NADH:ubiquinone oxidoreductase subunit 6 (subunit J)